MISAMSHQVLPLAISALAGALCAFVVMALISRFSGQSLPSNPFKRRGKGAQINPEQHVFIDGIAFAVFVGISDLADRWLRLKWYGEGSFDQYVVGGALMAALLAGTLYGLLTAFASRKISSE